MMKMNALDWIAFILVIIGGLNWGLVGLFNYDAVSILLGSIPMLTNIIFDLVGLAAVYMLVAGYIKMMKNKKMGM